ncbi:MAG: hypothetical protein QXO71_09570, partial [Candidatus Jordarchaeaceae archaeon]
MGKVEEYAKSQGINAAQIVKRVFGKDKEYAVRYLLMISSSLGIPQPKETKGKKFEAECNPESCGYYCTARINGVADFCPHFCESFLKAYCDELGISVKIEPPKNGKNGKIEKLEEDYEQPDILFHVLPLKEVIDKEGIFDIKCKIKSIDPLKTVNIKNEMVNLREAIIFDDSYEAKLVAWRDKIDIFNNI